MEAVAAGLVFVIGIVFAFAFFPDFIVSLKTDQWVRVEGIVTHSRVSISHGTDRTTYSPEVRYRYEYQNRRYTGRRIAMVGRSARYKGYAEEVLKAYPKGAPVAVYVDPTKPSRAVLQPGTCWGALIASLFGGGAMAFAVLVWSGRI